MKRFALQPFKQCKRCALPQISHYFAKRLDWCRNATEATCALRKSLNLMSKAKNANHTGCSTVSPKVLESCLTRQHFTFQPCSKTFYTTGKKELSFQSSKQDGKQDKRLFTKKRLY